MKVFVLSLLLIGGLAVTLPSNSQVFSPLITFYWDIINNDTLRMGAVYNQLGWFGVGFGTGMIGADIITFELNSARNGVVITDRKAVEHAQPPADSSQDVTLVEFEVGTGNVSVVFERKLNTGDANDAVISINSNQSMIFAGTTNPTIEYHGPNRGITSVMFGASAPSGAANTSNATSNETSNATSNGTSNGTGNVTTNGASNATSNGTSNETSNGTSNGTGTVTTNGASNETSNGTSNETSNATSNGTSNETSNATSNVTNVTSNGTSNETSNGTSNGTGTVTTNGTSNETGNGTSNVTNVTSNGINNTSTGPNPTNNTNNNNNQVTASGFVVQVSCLIGILLAAMMMII